MILHIYACQCSGLLSRYLLLRYGYHVEVEPINTYIHKYSVLNGILEQVIKDLSRWATSKLEVSEVALVSLGKSL